MILNPFCELSTTSHSQFDSDALGGNGSEESSDCSSSGSSRSSGSRSSIEKKERPAPKFWSTTQMNKECLKQLKDRIDR